MARVRCYDHQAPRKAPPLNGRGSSFDDEAPADLPLRDELSASPEPARPVERELFASEAASYAADDGVSAPRRGVSVWLVAAMALVIGIVIGFFSGYEASRRQAPVAGEALVAPADNSRRQQAAQKTFTESAVADPVAPARVDPEPIVAAPPAQPVAPQPSPTTPPEPVARRERPAPERGPAAVERAVASGPGSLQVVSRPAGAQVVVDGRVVGTTPLVLPNVSSGRHDVRIELTGFRQWATSVEVTPGARTRVAASLEQ